MRLVFLALAASLLGAPAYAGDGADSPQQIDKFTKQLAKVAKCSVRSGELNFLPVACKAKATKDKAPNGATLWHFEYYGKNFGLVGTLAPENGKLTFAGTSTCAGKDKPTTFEGKLFRKAPTVWEGDLTPQVHSAMCGPFQLTIGK